MMLLPFFFLVSAFSLLPGQCEVVSSSFHKCSDFFFKKKPPNNALTPRNEARICQKYKDRYVFATMYDKTNRIPIYSAYVYSPKSGDRSGNWMIEPQLANSHYGPNMEDERDTTIAVEEIEASQATFNDYKVAAFTDKGHLNPVAHQPDDASKNATFTLTNIVPQFSKLNQGLWKDYETTTMAAKNSEFGCRKIYVITGVVPGDTSIAEGRVNYPSHIWSAACCEIDKNRRKSWGVIASNKRSKNPRVTERTLRELELELETLYKKKKVELFGNSCY